MRSITGISDPFSRREITCQYLTCFIPFPDLSPKAKQQKVDALSLYMLWQVEQTAYPLNVKGSFDKPHKTQELMGVESEVNEKDFFVGIS